MAIDPSKASGAQPPNGARLDQTGGNQSARQSEQLRAATTGGASRAADHGGDQVELSPEVLAAGQTSPATTASGLGHERLRMILKRLTSGYYDTPTVVQKVASKISDAVSKLSRTD